MTTHSSTDSILYNMCHSPICTHSCKHCFQHTETIKTKITHTGEQLGVQRLAQGYIATQSGAARVRTSNLPTFGLLQLSSPVITALVDLCRFMQVTTVRISDNF